MKQGEDLLTWQRRWQEGHTNWDQGQEHPQLPRLLQHAQLEGRLATGSAIYAGGCGRAHNEAFLARKGYAVTAMDLVPEAIDAARQLYQDEARLRLVCGDSLSVPVVEQGQYEAVFDRAMLCALQPAQRRLYHDAVCARLKPGGLFMAILFRRVLNPAGPPFAVDEASADELWSDRFDLCFAAAAPAPLNPVSVVAEWLCIWRLRSDAA